MKKSTCFFIVCLMTIPAMISYAFSGDNIKYVKYTSHDRKYSVEIPDDIPVLELFRGWMYFFNVKDSTSIIITSIKKAADFENLVSSCIDMTNFKYSTIERSDTSIFYKVERDADNWKATEMAMLKYFKGNYYAIYQNVQIKSKNIKEAESIIRHIYSSFRSDFEPVTLQETIYVNPFFSISYPAEWKSVQDFAVFSAESQEGISFTVSNVKSSFSLSYLNEQTIGRLLKKGHKIYEHKKVRINGADGFKIKFNENENQSVTYSFEKFGRVFTVKFEAIGDFTESHIAMIDRIINSFKITLQNENIEEIFGL